MSTPVSPTTGTRRGGGAELREPGRAGALGPRVAFPLLGTATKEAGTGQSPRSFSFFLFFLFLNMTSL